MNFSPLSFCEPTLKVKHTYSFFNWLFDILIIVDDSSGNLKKKNFYIEFNILTPQSRSGSYIWEVGLSCFQHLLLTLLHVKSDWRLLVGKDREEWSPSRQLFKPTGTCRAPGCLSQKEQLRKGSDAPLPFQWGWFYENTFDWMTSCEVMLTFLLQSTIKPQSNWFHPTLCCLSSVAPYHLALSFSFFTHSLSLFTFFLCWLNSLHGYMQSTFYINVYLVYPDKDEQILLH